MKHLWEVEHDYYCIADDQASYDTWEEFINEEGDADMDYNLVFRWDWDKSEDESRLLINTILQRKGRLRSIRIENMTDADEMAVMEYLKPRMTKLTSLWSPIQELA